MRYLQALAAAGFLGRASENRQLNTLIKALPFGDGIVKLMKRGVN